MLTFQKQGRIVRRLQRHSLHYKAELIKAQSSTVAEVSPVSRQIWESASLEGDQHERILCTAGVRIFTIPELLNCSAVYGGGWCSRYVLTACFW
jgi:hypothetical protein